MDDAQITDIAVQTMIVAAKVSAPILLTALLVGFAISLFQAATQIQEQTLTFVPKLVVAAIVLVLTGGWCLRVLEGFTREVFTMIPALLAS